MNTKSGQLTGMSELLKVLNTLGDEKLVNKLLKKTNRNVLKPVQKSMKGLAFPQRLTKKMAIRASNVDGNKHPNALVVGPTSDVYPIRFLNTGTVERYTKAGAYRGAIKGKNIIAPLLDRQAKSVQEKATEGYGEDLVKATKSEVKRINRNK